MDTYVKKEEIKTSGENQTVYLANPVHRYDITTLSTEIINLSSEVSAISSTLSTEIINLSSEVSAISSTLSTEIENLSSTLSTEIENGLNQLTNVV